MSGRLRNPPYYVSVGTGIVAGSVLADGVPLSSPRTVTGAFTVTATDNNNTIAINVSSGGVAGTMTPGLPVGFVVEFSELAGTLSGTIIGNAVASSGPFVLHQTAFAGLPACSSTFTGWEYYVTDSTTSTFGATITGSGSNNVVGLCNGTNWVVH